MNKLIDLPCKSLEYMLDDNIIMIDVRRKEEWLQTGIIKNSHTLTFFDEYGRHDTVTWLKELEHLCDSKDTMIVLICAHANRTRMIGNFLIHEHEFTNIVHLAGGIVQWLDEGREVIPYAE